ncbi:MAG: family 43 glycosylhydrolase [Bacteroidales bacterium]|nr:family 43 glycosylhydrolase [Bacteroidales bacterium]
MNLRTLYITLGLFILVGLDASAQSVSARWSNERINNWYDQTPYLVGANYVPASAINQLEMWQEDTFDPQRIEFELRKSIEIGMNTMRVFLHDLAWKQDPEGFFQRVDQYLEIADRNGILTMFVIFDGVWNPYPKAGKQPEPTPRVHNSGWIQSPGRIILDDEKKQDELKVYVQAVVRRYKDDRRVIIWDLFNEPDNANVGNFGGGSKEPDLDKQLKKKRATQLLEKTFRWVREVNPSQPLTAAVWGGPNWLENPDDIEKLSLEQSDIISFHSYANAEKTLKMIEGLKKYKRPLLCTEYMARGANSKFETHLPMFNEHRVGAYNWGLFDGKSQTIYPWNSWKKKYNSEPDPWFHDVFRKDGTPYSKEEIKVIKEYTARPVTAWENVPSIAKPDAAKIIKKGLKKHDRALLIKDGWIRDPYIVLGPDNHYYLTGTTPLPDEAREAGDPYNLGLGRDSYVGWKAGVWRSKDLIEWEDLERPFDLKDGIWVTAKPDKFKKTDESKWRLWAPELHWLGNRWALVHTSPVPAKGANFSLTQGAEVKGPWENPMGAKIGHRHDPSLFKDDDGSLWMVWGATKIAKVKSDLSGFEGKEIKIGPSGQLKNMGHEGCLLMKIEGKYVLFGTGWSTGKMRKGSYNLYYAVADKIEGPYSERKFTGRFLGHGTPFKTKDGKWWCTAFFNANLPPVPAESIEFRNLAHTAYTINQRGTTIVPLDVYTDDKGELIIRAKVKEYATPGPDEMKAKVAPAPLFIDPAYHGSCDPEIVKNESDGQYYIYYTSRRSTIQDNFVATPIGVISSPDLMNWSFKGYCKFDGVGGSKDANATFWAPAIISHQDTLHMFVTWKPDIDAVKNPWGGSPGRIVHYKAPESDPVNGWKKVEVMHDTTMNTIDAAVYQKDDLFHVWFKGKKKGQKKNELYHRVSKDMKHWEDRGFSKSDVFNQSVTGSGFEEAPYMFTWKGKDWLITDPHKGLFVYSSDDGEHWNFQGTILEQGGERKLDNTMARHCSVVVKNNRAFIFYHVEPWRDYAGEKTGMPIFKQPVKNRQSVLQMAELEVIDGKLVCKRDHVNLN